ncbi:MAG: hypothetical protein Kow0042_11150 [Calditrichia bacterium]
MISELFPDLPQVEGVELITIYGLDNEILDSWSQPHFNRQILPDLGLNGFQIFSLGERVKQSLSEVVLTHEKGQIYYRRHRDFMVVVISKLKVDAALIRLIINVGLGEYEKSKKIQKSLKKMSRGAVNFLDNKYLDDLEAEFLEKLKHQSETP